MSRSKHTDPAEVRAARRLRAPFQSRGAGDLSAIRKLKSLLKKHGIIGDTTSHERLADKPPRLPSFATKRPRKGFQHPVSTSEIRQLLKFFGESCYYGVKAIELAQQPANARPFLFGRLRVPGRISLYEQPPSPWFIVGTLEADDLRKLKNAGAQITESTDGLHTLVEWPDETLKQFMLFDVFMHELGHHMIQQYKGKRKDRVVRTADHELFAEQFSRSCRKLWLAAETAAL